MKTYKRGRTSSEFIEAAKAAGLQIDMADYYKGGDWIVARGTLEGEPVEMLFNVVNQRVIGIYGDDDDENLFTTDTDKHDGEPWFDAILDLANTNEPRKAAISKETGE